MYLIALWVGKSLITLLRLLGRSGSALPGLVALAIDENFLEKAAKKLNGSIIVTGTNGKTTTAKMIEQILKDQNYKVFRNSAGSNMSRGIASSFIEHSSFGGVVRSEWAVLEVDEAFSPVIAAIFKPKVTVALNLLRDQLDRYGELDTTAGHIGRAISYSEAVVLNGDDSLVAELSEYAKGSTYYFGAVSSIAKQLPYDAALHSHKKSATKNSSSKIDTLLLKERSSAKSQVIEFTYKKESFTTELKLPGVYNAYNALAAFTAAVSLNVDKKDAALSLGRTAPAFGRAETVMVGDRELQIFLVKNPAGYNQIIETFLTGKKGKHLLMAVNDKIADGRDVSWLWDVNFEKLKNMNHKIICSGIRGFDLAVRLKYTDTKSTTELNLEDALVKFIDSLAEGEQGYVIPTYTAMLELRELLNKKANLDKIWEAHHE